MIAAILTAAGGLSAQGVISTVAGNGTAATTGDGGPATSASLQPTGVTVDSAGNIYVADTAKSVIRKIDTAGIITTVAGNGSTQFSGDGGPATSATIYLGNQHNGLALDNSGNLYIADYGHNRVRKVDASGIITTVAGNGGIGFSGDGGPATGAQLRGPSGVAFDSAGNLYVVDALNFRVRKVDTSGIITTVAGIGLTVGTSGDGGPATSAGVLPTGVAVDAAGNLYIVERDGLDVRKVNPAGIISTIAGVGNGAFGFSGDGGPATAAKMAGPYGVAVDNAGNIYIADYGNNRVRKVDSGGVIHTAAGGGGSLANIGDGGPPTSALLQPSDVAVDAAGNYYIADTANNRVRKVTVGARAPGLSVGAASLYYSYFTGTLGGAVPQPQVVSVTTADVDSLPFRVSVSTSSGGPWLGATPLSGNTPALISIPVNNPPAAGTYKGNIALTPIAPDLPVVNIPVTLNVTSTAVPKPVISANGVQNGASFLPGVVSGALATVKGTNLASTTDNWNSLIASGVLPTSLDGVTVTFDGQPAYLTYISPTQINLVTPNLRQSTTVVVVTNSGQSASLNNVPANKYSPAFFTWPGNQAVATRQDYSYAVKAGTFAGATTAAAKPGDVLILWGTGFGATTPAAPAGIPVPGDATYSTSTPPAITINNVAATVYGAALASGYVGLYQVAIQVPATLADGDWPIVASIGGVQSASGIVLSVKH
jgi:uncharacterized protein (TIGR03437 family)